MPSRPPRRVARCTIPIGAPAVLLTFLVFLVLVSGLVWSAGEAEAQARPPTGVAYLPPVDAPIADPFRLPPSPYASGNRGIDYSTVPGAAVAAMADGVVLFAGPVAGAMHVTVEHADGLRSTYSFLAGVSVSVGQAVIAGSPVGIAAALVHVGIRDLLGNYLDPASLFGSTRRAVLVPGGDDGAPEDATSFEVPFLSDIVHEAAQRWGPSLSDLVGLLPTGIVPPGLSLAALHQLVELDPMVHTRRLLDRFADLVLDPRPCTAASAPVPAHGERRVLVLVAGFGSTSESAAADDVDAESLGYDPADVVRFSYNGGRTPSSDRGGNLAGLPTTTYDLTDSQRDLPSASEDLRTLLAQVAEAEPGVPIDVVAHSQGGVVTRLALGTDAHAQVPDAVDAVVTLGTPHHGADLATAADALNDDGDGAALLDLAHQLGFFADQDQPSLGQLSEVSPVIDQIADTPIPDGVRFRSVSARGDLVVPSPRSAIEGGEHVIVAGSGLHAHDGLPGSSAATREIGLAVADLAPTCESLADAVVDAIVGEGIGWGEDALGAGLSAAARANGP